jgi:hypothetical protein
MEEGFWQKYKFIPHMAEESGLSAGEQFGVTMKRMQLVSYIA